MDQWKIISQKSIFKAKLFEIKETKIKKDKTVKAHHDIFRRPTVYVFPLTESYEIYLISEYRYLHKKRVLGAIAGFVNEGESSLDAARREMKEEAGITAEYWEEFSRLELAASVIKATVHLFLAKGLEVGKQKLEDDEDILVEKIPLQEAVKKVISREITLLTTVSGIFLLDQLRKEGKI